MRNPRLVIGSLSGWGPGRDPTPPGPATISPIRRWRGRSPRPPRCPGVQAADLIGAWSLVIVDPRRAARAGADGRGEADRRRPPRRRPARQPHRLGRRGGGRKAVGERLPLTGALPCYNVYETADGRKLALGALEPHFWERFCRAGRACRTCSAASTASSLRVRREMRELFRSRTLKEWMELARAARTSPSSPCSRRRRRRSHPAGAGAGSPGDRTGPPPPARPSRRGSTASAQRPAARCRTRGADPAAAQGDGSGGDRPRAGSGPALQLQAVGEAALLLRPPFITPAAAHREHRPPRLVVLHPHRALVVGDDAVDDGEPQARAPPLGGEIGQEELLLRRRRDAAAGVGDLDLQVAVRGWAATVTRPGRLGRLDRVVDQVDQGALDLLAVDPDRGRARGATSPSTSTPAFRSR